MCLRDIKVEATKRKVSQKKLDVKSSSVYFQSLIGTRKVIVGPKGIKNKLKNTTSCKLILTR